MMSPFPFELCHHRFIRFDDNDEGCAVLKREDFGRLQWFVSERRA